jgi:hypothetical protein
MIAIEQCDQGMGAALVRGRLAFLDRVFTLSELEYVEKTDRFEIHVINSSESINSSHESNYGSLQKICNLG